MPALTPRQEIFVAEFLIDFNASQAAVRAGYSPKTAKVQGSRLLTNANVQREIARQKTERIERLKFDADVLMLRWQQQVECDMNEIAQHRRVPCRHCYGINFGFQFTPAEFAQAKLAHEEKRAEVLAKSDQQVDIDEFPGVDADWYDRRKEPNTDCPECFGDGIPHVYLADTRKLSPAAKTVYEGVKEGRDGIEIKTASKQKAEENLARAACIFKDKVEIEGGFNMPTPQELDDFYAAMIAKSKEAGEKVKGRSERIRQMAAGACKG